MSQDDRDEDRDAEPAEGAVRRRVVRHLRSLLLPGAIGLTACKHPVVCDPMPGPSETDAATSGNPPGGSSSTPPVVCDPMPPPPPVDAGPSPSTAPRTPPAATRESPPPVVCDPMPAPPPAPKKK